MTRSGREGEGLDLLDTEAILERLARGSQRALDAVSGASPSLRRLVDLLVVRWREGGRLVYVGAGTSGRIALLDAAECEPTFGVPPGRVVALLAGGAGAFGRAIEGAEDDDRAGALAIDELDVGPSDLVVGISASGTTPYTVAALRQARRRGASTGAITGSPEAPLAHTTDVAVVLDVGPEVVEGSTRLQAGTAQKLACNALTTAAFVRLGRIQGRSMVAMRATSAKLRRRAREILRVHAGVSPETADELLERSGGEVDCALVMAATGGDAAEARELLRACGGDVPRALAAGRRPA